MIRGLLIYLAALAGSVALGRFLFRLEAAVLESRDRPASPVRSDEAMPPVDVESGGDPVPMLTLYRIRIYDAEGHAATLTAFGWRAAARCLREARNADHVRVEMRTDSDAILETWIRPPDGLEWARVA